MTTFKAKVKTKVFSKLNTLDLSLVLVFTPVSYGPTKMTINKQHKSKLVLGWVNVWRVAILYLNIYIHL